MKKMKKVNVLIGLGARWNFKGLMIFFPVVYLREIR